MRRLRHMHAGRALSQWQENVYAEAEQLQLVRRAVGAIRLTGLRRAFNGWSEAAADAAAEAQLMRGVLSSLVNSNIRKALR